MYCGDETGSFVGDIGSNTSRFGYGGEDTPKYVVPSYSYDKVKTKQVPSSCYHYHGDVRAALRTSGGVNDGSYDQPVTDPLQYLQQGDQIQDWEAYEQLWQSSFDALSVRQTRKHTTGGKPFTTGPPSNDSTTLSSRNSLKGEGKCVHPLLVVTPGCTHSMGQHTVGTATAATSSFNNKQQMKLVELMMETFEAKALFLAPTPMLAAFSLGRQTCLVADVGAGGCRVTPVVDGLLLKQSQRRNGQGGDWLSNIQWKAMQEIANQNNQKGSKNNNDDTTIRARYELTAPDKVDASASSAKRGIFHRWAMQNLMHEFQTSGNIQLAPWRVVDTTTPFVDSCKPSTDKGGEEKPKNNDVMDVDSNSDNGSSTKQYQLPDGTVIDLESPIGKDLCRTSELFFSDTLPFQDGSSSSNLLNQHATLSNAPLHKLIHESLSAVDDVDLRKTLATSIVLSGAASLQLEKRLSWEMSQLTTFKTKVVASRHVEERAYAAWIGGSILSSLGSFQQLWLSRDEYDEYGATLAVQRFP